MSRNNATISIAQSEAANLDIEPNFEDLCAALEGSTESHVSPPEVVLELLVKDVRDVIKIEDGSLLGLFSTMPIQSIDAVLLIDVASIRRTASSFYFLHPHTSSWVHISMYIKIFNFL